MAWSFKCACVPAAHDVIILKPKAPQGACTKSCFKKRELFLCNESQICRVWLIFLCDTNCQRHADPEPPSIMCLKESPFPTRMTFMGKLRKKETEFQEKKNQKRQKQRKPEQRMTTEKSMCMREKVSSSPQTHAVSWFFSELANSRETKASYLWSKHLTKMLFAICHLLVHLKWLGSRLFFVTSR